MPKTAARTRVQLTDRDRQLLQHLARLRFLSVPQVASLGFPSLDAAAARLRQLRAAGLVSRLYRAGLVDDPHRTTVYGLSRAGAQQVRTHPDQPAPPHVVEGDARSGLFLTHTLRRNDVALSLMHLTRHDPRFQLLRWTHDPDLVRASATVRFGTEDEDLTMIPDGLFEATWRGERFVAAVEVDMGTVRLERMFKRYRGYWSWWKRGGAILRHGPVSFRVLTLTTTETHLAALRRAAVRAPLDTTTGSGLFWFALLSTANLTEPSTWLHPIWTIARLPTGPPVRLVRPF